MSEPTPEPPPLGTVPGAGVVTAHQVMLAVEAVLRERLPALAIRAGLEPVATWQQVPTIDALTSASVPALAITSPGITEAPKRRAGVYEATWRVAIGIYDRGRDHEATAGRVRTWAAIVRAALTGSRLGGIAAETTWVGEDYASLPGRDHARTIAGAAVAFDVRVPAALGAPDPDLGGETTTTVILTETALTIAPTATSVRASAGVRPT